MKTDEITTPNYFIYEQTETPYHHTGETGTRQIISSYLNEQNNNADIKHNFNRSNKTPFALSLSLLFWNK